MAIQVFEGVKVADFTWAIAGPFTTKYLADHGAEVIHIESIRHIDVLRVAPPYKDRQPGVNRSAYGANPHRNKYGIALNLSLPKGIEVAKRIIRWADIVAENFVPGTMKKWGLDYEELKMINPSVIMTSLSNQGQTGPYADHSGIGYQLTALAGFGHITGWPDRGPTVPYGAYTDYIAPRFAATALIAALDYRRRTGKGQYLDLSQYEAAIHFLSPLVLDFTVNKRVAGRPGNRCSYAAPHGVYPCCGDDRWCAIAVFSDEDWQGFCRALGNPDWIQAPRFATLKDRKEHEDELDSLIAEWTSGFSAHEVMTKMQEAGVAAGVVNNCEDLFEDPDSKGQHMCLAVFIALRNSAHLVLI